MNRYFIVETTITVRRGQITRGTCSRFPSILLRTCASDGGCPGGAPTTCPSPVVDGLGHRPWH